MSEPTTGPSRRTPHPDPPKEFLVAVEQVVYRHFTDIGGGRVYLDWQPIDETTPQNELMLLYRPQLPQHEQIAVRRIDYWCGPTCCPLAEPTHFMPLPDPPAARRQPNDL
jgi:hypothetical protein